MAVLFTTWPNRAPDAATVHALSSIYRQALDDLTDAEFAGAVAQAVMTCRFFPVPAELRELARPVKQPSRHPEADFDLIRAQAGVQGDPGMRLLPERATDEETFRRRRLMRDNPAAFGDLVQEQIKAAGEKVRQDGLAFQRAANYSGRRSYQRRVEADALLEGLRRQRQEGR